MRIIRRTVPGWMQRRRIRRFPATTMLGRGYGIRLFFMANTGVLLFGFSWPFVLGLYWLPVVYAMPMVVATWSSRHWWRRTPVEAILDLPNAAGSFLVCCTVTSAVFVLLTDVSAVRLLLVPLGPGISVGVMCVALKLMGYFDAPRRPWAARNTAHGATGPS